MADAFMEEGEYYRAITEYKKLLILFPDSEWADYALSGWVSLITMEEYDLLCALSRPRIISESSYVPKGYYFKGLATGS